MCLHSPHRQCPLHALLQRFAAGACCVLALVLTGDARSADTENAKVSVPVERRAAASDDNFPQAAPSDDIAIGLVDTFSPEAYLSTFVPTFEHLLKTFGESRIRIVELHWNVTAEDIRRADLDFVVTSASTYAALIDSAGTHQIATRRPKSSNDVSHTVASLFVTAAESPIKTLAQAKGMSVAISHRQSFDGWLIAQGELAALGLDPKHHFGEVIETRFGIPDVATLVRTGLASTGVLGSCEYETLIAERLLKPGDLRILNEKPTKPGECRRSTEKYPDIVFSSLPNADSDVVNRMAVALLSLPTEKLDFRWTIANDFVPTLELLKTLHLGPYAEPEAWTLARFWATYRTEIVLFVAFCAAVLFHILTLNVLVRRRTNDLRTAFRANEQLLRERNDSRQRLMALERTNIVAQLSNMFAHEIKQPIMNIACYAAALKLLLKREGTLSTKAADMLELLSGEVDRSGEIVEHVRSYAKNRSHARRACDLGRVVAETLKNIHDPLIVLETSLSPGAPDNTTESVKPNKARKNQASARQTATNAFPVASASYPISADPFEIEFIVANFIKNARAAVKGLEAPSVALRLERDERTCRVTVTDNGPPMSDDTFASLGTVSASKKTEGLGFGLAIALALAERNGGHLAFERLTPSGLSASLVLPIHAAAESDTNSHADCATRSPQNAAKESTP